MITEKIELNNRKKFETPVLIPEAFIDAAIEIAVGKLLNDLPRMAEHFPLPETIDGKYEPGPENGWTCGMSTGIYWLAYELTGDRRFFDAARKQTATYEQRFESKEGLMGHDVGFLYTPSCVADYKITGNEQSRELSLKAAQHLIDICYSEAGGFIKRASAEHAWACRTLVDTMMNVPLVLWAGKESGNDELTKKAISHYETTAKYLVRGDGSTFHHYQFNPETMAPEGGLTLQGFSDSSCWSRGHAWLIYGYPVCYSYTHDENIPDIHRAVTYYFLNQLPEDNIPYWDLVFTEGSEQPRDASAAAVSVCGLLEMCGHLNDDNPDKAVFKNAADRMMKALIQKCSNTDYSKDGILTHVTHALPQGRGIDASAVYGDYFYLEALLRYKNPNWKMYW